MKKKMFAILTALCCIFPSVSMTAEAAAIPELLDGEEIICENDAFLWTNYHCYYKNLEESELPRMLVTGMYSNQGETEICYYMLSDMAYGQGTEILVSAEEVRKQLQEDSEMPVLGDFLECNASVMETWPGQLGFYEEEGCIRNLGHSTDLFGQEFNKVIHHYLNVNAARENEWNANLTSIDIYYGDIDDNDSVDIVDVIVLNKNLLTGYAVNDYGQTAADVDHNGIVNATDSLNILKYVVGIIDDFETLS